MVDITIPSKPIPATLKAVTDFFRAEGQSLKGFTEEWKQLTELDKEQIKTGIGDDTLNY